MNIFEINLYQVSIDQKKEFLSNVKCFRFFIYFLFFMYLIDNLYLVYNDLEVKSLLFHFRSINTDPCKIIIFL